VKVELKAFGREAVSAIEQALYEKDSRAMYAAAAAFKCVYVDHGANHEFAVEVDHRPDHEYLVIKVYATGVGGPVPADEPQKLTTPEESERLQRQWDRTHPPVSLTPDQLATIADQLAAKQEENAVDSDSAVGV
jgi:hypothetical protein